MKTVFLFVANYVYSSDFLRTSYIEYLSSKYTVVVLMPSRGLREAREPYPALPNVTYLPWDVQYPWFWNIFTKFFRYSLSRKFDDEPVLQRNHAKNLKGWRRRSLRAFSYLFPRDFFNPDRFSKWERRLLPMSRDFKKLCERYHPALIITSSPGFNPYDAEAITFAGKLSVPSAAVNFSWDNFHNGAHSFRKPDSLILWNAIMKTEAVTMQHVSPANIHISGPIRFDSYFQGGEAVLREEFLRSKGLDPKEQTILITTVTDGNYPLESELIRDLLEERERGAFPGFPNVFIRLHPKDSYEKYKRFESYTHTRVEEAGKRQTVDLGSRVEMDEEDITNLERTLRYADVVVNYASTITLEAFCFDKPVVNIGFPAAYLDAYTFTHYKPIVDAGAVRVAKSLAELLEDVSRYLEAPETDRANRARIFEEFIHFKDGLSYQRSVDFLDQIVVHLKRHVL